MKKRIMALFLALLMVVSTVYSSNLVMAEMDVSAEAESMVDRYYIVKDHTTVYSGKRGNETLGVLTEGGIVKILEEGENRIHISFVTEVGKEKGWIEEKDLKEPAGSETLVALKFEYTPTAEPDNGEKAEEPTEAPAEEAGNEPGSEPQEGTQTDPEKEEQTEVQNENTGESSVNPGEAEKPAEEQQGGVTEEETGASDGQQTEEATGEKTDEKTEEAGEVTPEEKAEQETGETGEAPSGEANGQGNEAVTEETTEESAEEKNEESNGGKTGEKPEEAGEVTPETAAEKEAGETGKAPSDEANGQENEAATEEKTDESAGEKTDDTTEDAGEVTPEAAEKEAGETGEANGQGNEAATEEKPEGSAEENNDNKAEDAGEVTPEAATEKTGEKNGETSEETIEEKTEDNEETGEAADGESADMMPMTLFALRDEAPAEPDPKDLPEPVTVKKNYKVEWWDDRNSSDRQNNHELKLTYYLPVVPVDGEEYGDEYVVAEKGGTKYLYKKNDDGQGTVTYELVYNDTPVTETVPLNPSQQEKYTYTHTFPAGAKNISAEWEDYPGYTKVPGDDSVTFIKNKEVTFTKTWFDEDNKLKQRPTVDEWILALDGSGELNPTADDVTESADGNTWTLKATVPAYSSMTTEITYTLEEDLSKIGKKYPDSPIVGDKGYATVQTNPLASQPSGKISTIYEGGTSESTLKGLTEFNFTKNWLDHGDQDNRPPVTFYLYRYIPKLTDMDTASPVRGMDSMGLAAQSGDGAYTFTSKNQSTLERFDENGNEYVYFILERINGSGYQSVIKDDNGNPVSFKYMDINGNAFGSNRNKVGESEGNVIYNLRVGTTGASATKTWDALAVQGLHGKVLFALQSRSKTSGNNGTWEFVKDKDGKEITQQQNGFKAEQMSMNVTLPGSYPKYDDDGVELEYRVVEVGAAVSEKPDDTDIPFSGAYENGDIFISDGYRFEVEYSPDGKTVINRLVGYTDLVVDKTFKPGIEDAKDASIWVKITRNEGFTQEEIDALRNTAGVTKIEGNPGDTSLAVKLEGTPTYAGGNSNLHVDMKNLSRYDSAGREYTYTLTELTDDNHPSTIGDETYVFSSQECSIREIEEVRNGGSAPEKIQEITSRIVNAKGGGDGLRFQVSKVWEDDNDLVCRREVVVGLYYLDGNGRTRCTGVTLNAQNGWFKDFNWPIDTTGKTQAEIDILKDYTRYIIVEESVGGTAVQDSGLENIYTQPGSAQKRYVTTDSHIYIVEDEANLSAGQAPKDGVRTITNTRVGELQVELKKTWNLGDMTGEEFGGAAGLTAVFEVKDDRGNTVDTLTVSKGATGPFLSKQLPKYDATGRIIGYTVTEVSLNGNDFTGNAISLGDYSVVSSAGPAVYTTGQYLHTHDRIEQTFSNTRTQGADLWVNKVWRDVGAAAQRPDIVMKLKRVSTNPKTPGKVDIILNDNLWDTTINEYFWECHFGSQPLYDGEGYRYKYYAVELIPQISDYKDNQTYYNVTGNQPDRASSPAESKDVFDKFGDNTTPAYPEVEESGAVVGEKAGSKTLSQPGTVINTPKKDTKFIAYKRWIGLPEWMQYINLPKVEVMLMRKLTATSTPEEVPNTKKDLISKEKYRYEQAVPVYNEYGIPYDSYYMVETDPKVEGYTSANVDKDVVNTYTGDPKIKITITKTWDWTEIIRQITGQEKYPDLEFELWQKLVPPANIATGRIAARVGTAKVSANTVIPGNTKVENTEEFTRTDGKGNEFEAYEWLYDPVSGKNEKVYYTYWVVEKGSSVTPAYEVKFTKPDTQTGKLTSGEYVLTDTDVTNKQYGFAVENKYKAKGQVEATKTWSDFDNAFGLRPGINDGVVTFTLWRKAPDAAAAEEVKDIDVAWTQTATNMWKCTFTPKQNGNETLPAYTTDNKPYTYYVTETLKTPYDRVYTEVKRNNPDLKVENTLNTVKVYAKKNWEFKYGSSTSWKWSQLDAAARTRILYFAGLGTKADGSDITLTFRVTAKEKGSGAEALVFTNGTKSYMDQTVSYKDWGTLCDVTGNGLRLLTTTNLPKYWNNNGTLTELVYEVTEVKVGGADVTNGQAGCVTVTDRGTVLSGTEYTDEKHTGTTDNAVELIKVTLEKEWNDQNNREGKRPMKLDVTIRSHANGTLTGKTSGVSLTWTNAAVPSTGNTGSAEYLLPRWDMEWNKLTYSFEEKVPADTKWPTTGWTYTASHNINDGIDQPGNISDAADDGDKVHFGNDYLPHKLRLNYSKMWDQKASGFEYWDLAFDTSITVKLQRKAEDESVWSDVTGCSVTLTRTGNAWNMPTVNDWVVDCYKEKASGEKIYASHMYTYRVVEVVNGVTHVPGETTKNGVKLSVNPGSVNGKIEGYTWEEKNDNGTKYMIRPASGANPIRFEMKNEPDLTSFTVEKKWAKDNKLTDRPATVEFQVYYKAGTGTVEFELKKDDGSKVILAVNSTGTATASNLPTYDKSGNKLTYFAKELDPSPLYVATSDNPAKEFTNTRKTVRLTVDKDWRGDTDNKFNTRKDLTISVYRGTKSAGQITWETTAWAAKEMPVGTTSVTFEDLPATYLDNNKQVQPYYYKVTETPKNSALANYSATVAVTPSADAGENGKEDKTGYDSYAYLSGKSTQTAQDVSLGKVTFFNTLDTTRLTVKKIWDDTAVSAFDVVPAKLGIAELQWKAGTAATATWETCPYQQHTEFKASDWSVKYENLPRKDENGNVYAYRVKENTLKGFALQTPRSDTWISVDSTAPGSGKVPDIDMTNKAVPVTVTVRKEWKDHDNKFNTRATSVNVELQWKTKDTAWTKVGATKSGEAYTADATLSAGNSWEFTFANLPIADKEDKPYSYRVVEAPVPDNYTVSYSPAFFAPTQTNTAGTFTVTNTLIEKKLKVTKVWDDQNDAYGTRPDSIVVTLQRRTTGEFTDLKDKDGQLITAKLQPGSWSAEFTELPVYAPGNNNPKTVYEYRVVEAFSDSVAGIPGYEMQEPKSTAAWSSVKTDLTGNNPTIFMTNKQQITRIEIEKKWNDNEDKYLTRPSSVTVELEWSVDEKKWETVQKNGTPVTSSLDAGGDWKHVFDNLPVRSKNQQIYYRVKETSTVYGYTTTGVSASITATARTDTSVQSAEIINTLQEVKLPVTKAWDDQYDQYGTRPDSLYVKLQRSLDGQTWTDLTDKTGTVTATTLKPTSWTYTFEHLPKVDLTTGTVWEYRAVEAFDNSGAGLTGYTMNAADAAEPWASIGVKTDTAGTFEIGLKNTRKTTSVRVGKSWEADGEDRYGTRPASVDVKLQWTTDGTWKDVTGTGFTATVTLKDGNNWTHTFDNLPVADKANKPLYYRVTEVSVPNGYTVSYQPEYKDGTKPGQQSNPLTLRVTNTLEKDNLTITKNWDDQSDGYGKRPVSLFVKLQWYRNGSWADVTETVKDVTSPVTVTLNNGNNWTHTFKDLPKKDPKTGNALSYRVVEAFSSTVAGLKGYTLTNSFGDAWAIAGADLTNGNPGLTLDNKQQVTAIHVKKTWKDSENKYATRPATLDVALEWNADPGKDKDWKPVTINGNALTATLDASVTWEATFADLPIADESNATLYYRVTETVPNGYAVSANPDYIEAKVTKAGAQELALTNTLEELKLTVTKTWDDLDNRLGTRPTDLYVKLQRSTDGIAWTDVTDLSGAVTSVTLNNGNKWTDDFVNLPKYDPKTGKVWQYRVTEALDDLGTVMVGYTLINAAAGEQWTVAGIAADSVKPEIELKNKQKTTTVQVSKSWEADDEDRFGTRTASVRVKLEWKTDGAWSDVTGTGFTGTVTLDDNNNWTHTFDNLPIADTNNKPLSYRVTEVNVPNGYTVSCQPADVPARADASFALKVTNTLEKDDLTITKNWDDQSDGYGKRPGSLFVKLQWNRNGRWSDAEETVNGVTSAMTVTLNAGNSWTHTFKDLPKMDPKTGNALSYRVVEAFSDTVSGLKGYTLTNAAGDAWAIAGADLTAGDPGLTLDNKQKVTAIGVKKTWDDLGNTYETRPNPEAVRVALEWNADPAQTADWKPVTIGGKALTATLDASVTWEATFTDLPIADENNDTLYYRIREITVLNGYDVTYTTDALAAAETASGKTQDIGVTNTLKLTGLTLQKRWEDQENTFNTRPADIRVVLERSIDGNTWEPVIDGMKKQVEATLNAAGKWKAEFKQLQAEDTVTGRAYTFRAVETVPTGYTGEVVIFTNGAAELLNTLNTVDLPVEKIWVDQENLYNTRPASLTLGLESSMDGGKTWQTVKNTAGDVTLVLNAGNGWKGTFGKLPKTDAVSGKDYMYRPKETVPYGYVSRDAELKEGKAVLTNTLEETTLTLTKTWQDQNNAARRRPTTLHVRLESRVGNGNWAPVTATTGPVEINLTVANGWVHTFTGLPLKDPATGNITEYRAVETVPANYRNDSTGVFVNGAATLVNTYVGTDYTLTVEYIYVTGETAAPIHVSIHLEGEDYRVVSPVIPGYTASLLEVAGTMPGHDVSYIVIYVPENDKHLVIIDDDPVALGPGDNNINVGDCFE